MHSYSQGLIQRAAQEEAADWARKAKILQDPVIRKQTAILASHTSWERRRDDLCDKRFHPSAERVFKQAFLEQARKELNV